MNVNRIEAVNDPIPTRERAERNQRIGLPPVILLVAGLILIVVIAATARKWWTLRQSIAPASADAVPGLVFISSGPFQKQCVRRVDDVRGWKATVRMLKPLDFILKHFVRIRAVRVRRTEPRPPSKPTEFRIDQGPPQVLPDSLSPRNPMDSVA